MKNFIEQSVEVEMLDGRREVVVIRRLPVGPFYQWVKALPERNLPRLTEMALQKPPGWADGLTDESFAKLANAAFAANFQRAANLSNQGEQFVAGVVLEQVVQAEKNLKNLETIGVDWTTLLATPPQPAVAEETPKPSSES